MTALEIILLVIKWGSLIGVALTLPYEIYGFFKGLDCRDQLLEKKNINPRKYEIIGIILVFVALFSYILHDQIFNN